jgi:hypothetical protein
MWGGIGALGPLVAAAIVGTDRRILHQLRQAQAVEPERATAIVVRSPLVRWRLSRLTTVGVVRALVDGRYYLDEAGWQEYRRQRRRRALSVMAGVLAAALALIWWQGRRG